MKQALLILLRWGKVFFVKSYFILNIIFNKYVKTRTTVYLSVFLLFSISYVSYFLNLVFTVPLPADVAGYQYSLFVSKSIKDFPAYKPIENSNRYFYRLGHSTSGIRDSLSFKSNASVSEIISYYQIYFDIIRANPVLEDLWTESFIMYSNNTQVFYVIATDAGANRIVAIERYLR